LTHEFVDPHCYVYRYDPTMPDGKGEFVRKFIPKAEDYHNLALAVQMHATIADCKGRNRKYNWDNLMPKVINMMVDEGKSLGDIAKELSVNYHSLKTQLRKHRLQEKARVKA